MISARAARGLAVGFAAGTGLLLAGAPAQALDVNNTDFYQCAQGNCRNGAGKVFDVVQGQWIEGNWQNGQTVAGEPYWVSHPLSRGKRYEQFYAADGMMARGTTLRGIGAMSALPSFTGTYGRVDHAFMRARLAVPEEGVYDMGNGIEYRGRFDYLPAKGFEAGRYTMGYFIFVGDKVDTEDKTTEAGLFVSDTAVGGGAVIRFRPARPDYMVVLQQQYQRELMIAAGDFQQQESEKAWRMAFAILGEVATTMAGARANAAFGGGGSAGNKFAMEMVSGLMKGNAGGASGASGTPAAGASADPSTRLIQMVTGAALGKITGDKALADKLSQAVATGIDKANAASK